MPCCRGAAWRAAGAAADPPVIPMPNSTLALAPAPASQGGRFCSGAFTVDRHPGGRRRAQLTPDLSVLRPPCMQRVEGGSRAGRSGRQGRQRVRTACVARRSTALLGAPLIAAAAAAAGQVPARCAAAPGHYVRRQKTTHIHQQLPPSPCTLVPLPACSLSCHAVQNMQLMKPTLRCMNHSAAYAQRVANYRRGWKGGKGCCRSRAGRRGRSGEARCAAAGSKENKQAGTVGGSVVGAVRTWKGDGWRPVRHRLRAVAAGLGPCSAAAGGGRGRGAAAA